jgi:hypothetical protein
MILSQRDLRNDSKGRLDSKHFSAKVNDRKSVNEECKRYPVRGSARLGILIRLICHDDRGAACPKCLLETERPRSFKLK